MIRKNVFIIFFIALISCLIHTNIASAAPKLEVKAEAGISNKVKYFTPLPLKLTITNNGSAFSGDLVIDAAESYAVGSATVYSLDIAEGETKTVQLYLNGLSDDYMYSGNQQGSLFYFYEGGIEEGELVKFSGDKMVRPQFHEMEGTFIYALTENRDRLTVFQRMRPFSNTNVEAFYLNQIKDFEFPDNKKGLEAANVLAIDETNISDFSEKQQQAILEWVRQGGKLLVGASDQVESSIGIFKEYLPLTLSQEKVSVTQSSLEKLSNNGKFTQGIEVYQASEKEGSIRLLGDGETILASATKLDEGQIIQTTFSLGDEPLASMDGYAKLLSNILKLQSPIQNNYGGMYYGNYYDYLPYEVGSINELFPSFEVSTTTLVVIIIIYILFIGPLLYFILKRLDKREHAWWIIPVVSVGLSIAMFIFGAKDRLTQSQIQQSAFYKVEENRLSGHYVETILTNRSGDFSFTLDENTTAVATRNRNYMGSSTQEMIHEKSYVKEHANSSTITLKNLNYWSVQSIVGQTEINNAGNMDIQLKVANGKVMGTIKNNFPFKLNDVSIWSGSREIELGDIEPNGTLEVDKEIKGAVLLSPSVGNYNYAQPQTKADLMPMRIEKLKYGAGNLVQGERLPAITAWIEEALVGIELDGNAANSPLSYIIQTFEPDLELSGEFTLDKDVLNKTIEPTSNSGYTELINDATNEWYLDKGEYDYITWIPEELLEKSTWTEISVSNKASIPIELAIWNIKTQEFESISEKSASITTNLDQYISKDGEVRIQITVDDSFNGGPTKLPDVKIKGVAK